MEINVDTAVTRNGHDDLSDSRLEIEIKLLRKSGRGLVSESSRPIDKLGVDVLVDTVRVSLVVVLIFSGAKAIVIANLLQAGQMRL